MQEKSKKESNKIQNGLQNKMRNKVCESLTEHKKLFWKQVNDVRNRESGELSKLQNWKKKVDKETKGSK